MGLFAGKNMNQFRSSKGGNYFKPGSYVGRLLSAKGIEYGHTGKKKTAFVAEFEILQSNNEEQPVGDKPSYFVKLSDSEYPETAYGNVADCMRAMIACLEACEGNEAPSIDEVDIEDEVAEQITSEEQPMAGTIMGISAVNITTKKGNPFTKISFFVPENAAELYAEA